MSRASDRCYVAVAVAALTIGLSCSGQASAQTEAPVRWLERYGKWTVKRDDRRCDMWGSPSSDVEIILAGYRGGSLNVIAVGIFDLADRETVSGSFRTSNSSRTDDRVLWQVRRDGPKTGLSVNFEEGWRITNAMSPADGVWIDAGWQVKIADPDPQFGHAASAMTRCLN